MNVKVCVGSACHVRGSHLVIEELEKFKKDYNIDIELKASFCLGRCSNGVSVEINGEKLSVTPQSIKDELLKRVER